MTDRIPLHPGRVQMTPVSGQENTYDLVRADSPVVAGTPLTKANLLSDQTETALWGNAADRTVDEALKKMGLNAQLKAKSVVDAVSGVDWTATTLPTTAKWSSVTYGNGKFVAVATGSTSAAYSTDGVKWTKATLPENDSWSSVTYGNGKFVAIALNAAAYSTNGITWTAAAMPAYRFWNSVTYGNGKFVAVSKGAVAAYSSNGITWTTTSLPASWTWSAVTYGSGKFVAVTNDSNVAAYSTDGITWTKASTPSASVWASVTYGNGVFVAVGNRADAAYSANGSTWSAATLPTGAYWSSVAYGNGRFVAVAESYTVAYSTDGISWAASSLPARSEWSSVAYGNGKFVAVTKGPLVGSGSTIAAYSEDTLATVYDSADILGNIVGGQLCVETGTYIGTGTYSFADASSIACSFAPDLVLIKLDTTFFMLIRGEGGIGSSSSQGSVFRGNAVSWWSTSNAEVQFNTSGKTYSFIALGRKRDRT